MTEWNVEVFDLYLGPPEWEFPRPRFSLELSKTLLFCLQRMGWLRVPCVSDASAFGPSSSSWDRRESIGFKQSISWELWDGDFQGPLPVDLCIEGL